MRAGFLPIAAITCVALLTPTPLRAAPSDGLERAAAPSWVRPIAWDRAETPRASTEFLDLLIDYQVNLDTQETYSHWVYLISSMGALDQGSRITIVFDPSYQSVTLHALKRWRRNQALSEENVEFQRIQREEGLEESLFSGEQSWLAFLKDVAVGDTIEVSYTARGFNPIFMGRYCDAFDIQGPYPVRHFSLRVVHDAGRTPDFTLFSPPSVRETNRSENATEYLLEFSDLDALADEHSLPYGFRPGPYLEISEFDSWAEVAEWGAGLYSSMESDSVKQKAQELVSGIETRDGKLLALLEYVQDDIRYLGIETGINSHQPHAPEEVLSNRFGDCKDKAALFCALARAAGCQAWPVLVSTWRRELVRADAPSPLSFNHVIAAVEREGTLLFLDPSRAMQGGPLSGRGLGDFGWGLVLGAGARELRELPKPRESYISVLENYSLKDLSGPASVDARYFFCGDSADYFRGRVAAESEDDLRRDFQELYLDQFKEVSITSGPVVTDDRKANRIELRIGLVVPRFVTLNGDGYGIELYPSLILEQVRDPVTVSARAYPMYFEHPMNYLQIQNITLPDEWGVPRAENTVEDPSFRLVTSVSSGGVKITIFSALKSLSDRVEPANWSGYLAHLEDSRSAIDWRLWKSEEPAKSPIVNSPPDNPAAEIGVFLGMLAVFFLTAVSMGRDY
jgi:hypothetical protein